MKNIVCYGDSNTWGFIAGTINEYFLASRYDISTRWTGVLQEKLGSQYRIIEAGLNGRSSAFDEIWISRTTRNGLQTLPLILEMAYPIDLVIFMLGTNDVKVQYNLNVPDIINGMEKLLVAVKDSHFGSDFNAPHILLISPVPIIKVNNAITNQFYDESSILKSQELAAGYQALSEKMGCAFLDAGKFATVSDVDGIHLDEMGHRDLAEAIAKKTKDILK